MWYPLISTPGIRDAYLAISWPLVREAARSSSSSSSSSSNRIDFRSRERYHPSTRREFDEGRPTHVGCTRARTCIGLKKRSRHPLFLRGIDIPNLFLDIVPQLLKPRLSSSVSFFRSDSDRGWPTIENWEWNLISRWDALAWNGKDARQGNGSRCYPWWLPLDVTVRDWDFLLLDNFISHFILQLSYFFSFA